MPTAWRNDRTIIRLECNSALPFIDVESIQTCNVLTRELAGFLLSIGINQPLDIPFVRGHGRLLTRAIAIWTYTQSDEDGNALYAGIRYTSRISNDWTNWAIFDTADVGIMELSAIDLNNSSFQTATAVYNLTPH